MIARALLVLLVVLNLGVAAWWWLRPPVAIAGVDALPADVPRLRLPSERRRTPENAPAPEVPVTTLPGDAVCTSLGPFADAAAAGAAQARLPAPALRSRVVERTAGRARGWRVLVPALPSAAEAEALATRFAAAGFSDYFVMREGADANAVALGRFQSEPAARRRAEALVAAGFTAVRAEPVGITRQSWLDLALPGGSDPSAVRAASGAAQAQPLDCNALR